ncbi:MAG: DUF1501 domain-containing protein [Kiritimatiellia bacterium]
MKTRRDVKNDGRIVELSRRQFLQHGLLGAAFLMASRLGIPPLSFAAAPPRARPANKARAVIQIWMWGGPSHLDTFDPKPDAGNDYTGPFNKPIASNVDGIRINELLPLLSKQADKYSIIRSMTHGINGHETASYIAQTGRPAGGRLVYPCSGAVVSLFHGYDAGYKGLVPPYIVLTELQGRFSESGFLGLKYKPFATGGDPAAARFAVEGVVLEDISDQRQRSRRELLDSLNTLHHAAKGDPLLTASDQARQQAYDLILGDGGKVFDLGQETEPVRERYGKNTFGQSCLAARRLIEKGVPYVTINYEGWDTHKQHFQIMRRKLPELDKGFSALLEDLSDRGLLDSTVVWWGGEFGRSPRVQWEAPWNGGRNHYGNVYSCVLAGGGFKGGRVVGASDARGEEVRERPVYPCDLIGSIYQQLGIDPDGLIPNSQGLNVRVTPDASENVKSGGRLKELS